MFKNMRGIISLLVVLGSFAFLFGLMKINLPDGNKDILMVAAGSILSQLNAVVQYFFGASKDKSDAEKAARISDPSVNSEIAPIPTAAAKTIVN